MLRSAINMRGGRGSFPRLFVNRDAGMQSLYQSQRECTGGVVREVVNNARFQASASSLYDHVPLG